MKNLNKNFTVATMPLATMENDLRKALQLNAGCVDDRIDNCLEASGIKHIKCTEYRFKGQTLRATYFPGFPILGVEQGEDSLRLFSINNSPQDFVFGTGMKPVILGLRSIDPQLGHIILTQGFDNYYTLKSLGLNAVCVEEPFTTEVKYLVQERHKILGGSGDLIFFSVFNDTYSGQMLTDKYLREFRIIPLQGMTDFFFSKKYGSPNCISEALSQCKFFGKENGIGIFLSRLEMFLGPLPVNSFSDEDTKRRLANYDM